MVQRLSRLLLLLMAVLPGLGLAGAWAQRGRKVDTTPVEVGESSGLSVSGIEVTAEGKTPREARQQGWREAQRLAWPRLWTQISGLPASSAPRLGDSALDGIISAIEVEAEALRGNRYDGRLTIVFDRTRASAYLGRFAEISQSPPMLLLPVLQDAAVRTSYAEDSPWLAAWLRFRASESAIDYVRLRANATDQLLLSAWQGERPDIAIWRQLVERYQVTDVLVPELILDRGYLGGPVSGLLIVRFGPGGRELGRLRLSNPTGNIDALMTRAVREADALYVRALRAGLLVPDPSLLPPAEIDVPDLGPDLSLAAAPTSLEVEVETPDPASLASLEARLRALPGITGIRVQSFVVAGRSRLAIDTVLDPAALALALDGAGLRIEGRLLRPRRDDEAPLQPPEAPPAPAPDGADEAPPELAPTGAP
jgi:hypothetical protein